MARLGEFLLSEKVLTAIELDEALENQVLHGVKLGTCLVELGHVSDGDLARCLGKKNGQPFMTKDQLLAFGTQNLSIISPAAIKKNRLIPVGTNGAMLRIATDNEFSEKKQLEIEKFLGRGVELIAVSGYAIDFFLEKIFGIERPGRFLSRYARPKTPENKPVAATEVKKEAGPIIIDGVEWKSLGDVTQNGALTPEGDDAIAMTHYRDDFPLSLSDTARRLSLAKTRDDVAKNVLDFLSNASGTVALVLLKDGIVRGWKASSNRRNLPGFETFTSAMENLPDLQQCVTTAKPVLGKSVTGESGQLMAMLNYDGEKMAYFPILLQSRVVAVLLCERTEKMNPMEAAELCLKASYALEILILRSKLLS